MTLVFLCYLNILFQQGAPLPTTAAKGDFTDDLMYSQITTTLGQFIHLLLQPTTTHPSFFHHINPAKTYPSIHPLRQLALSLAHSTYNPLLHPHQRTTPLPTTLTKNQPYLPPFPSSDLQYAIHCLPVDAQSLVLLGLVHVALQAEGSWMIYRLPHELLHRKLLQDLVVRNGSDAERER